MIIIGLFDGLFTSDTCQPHDSKTVSTQSIDTSDRRVIKVINDLKRVAPVIRREQRKSDSFCFSMLEHYSDDIVLFSLSDLCKSYDSNIYIHAKNDDEFASGNGIIFTYSKYGSSGTKIEWRAAISDRCRHNILTHLENIVKKYDDLPTNESLYCNKVQAILDGTYVKPAKVEPIKAKVKTPEPKTLSLYVIDKQVMEFSDALRYMVTSEDKNVYECYDRSLFNKVKLNKCNTFNLSSFDDTVLYSIVENNDENIDIDNNIITYP